MERPNANTIMPRGIIRLCLLHMGLAVFRGGCTVIVSAARRSQRMWRAVAVELADVREGDADAVPLAEEVEADVSGALVADLERRGGMHGVAHDARSSKRANAGTTRGQGELLG